MYSIYICLECREGLEAFVEKSREICLIQPITVFTGTWNVNGGKNVNNIAFRETTCTGKEQAGLKSWIFPTKHCMYSFSIYFL